MKRKFAILGVGMAGEMQVRASKAVTNAELVAVADIDTAKVTAALAKQGVSVPLRDSLKSLLAQDDFDTLLIALPSAMHTDAAIEAMNAGKDVIIEKPLDITLEKIDQMLAVSKKTGRKIAGIFQNRFNPANRLLKQAIDAGRFGQITWAGAFVLWIRDQKYYQSWRGTWAMDGGGAIMNNSIHSIDLLQWLIGPVDSVSAYAAERAHPGIETEDTLSGTIRFKNGVLGTIVGSTGMFPGRPARIEIGSYNGSAITEGALKEFKFREPQPGDEKALEPLPAIDLQGENLQHIFEAWSAGKEPETSGIECRKAVQIVLALYQSAKQNGAAVKIS